MHCCSGSCWDREVREGWGHQELLGPQIHPGLSQPSGCSWPRIQSPLVDASPSPQPAGFTHCSQRNSFTARCLNASRAETVGGRVKERESQRSTEWENKNTKGKQDVRAKAAFHGAACSEGSPRGSPADATAPAPGWEPAGPREAPAQGQDGNVTDNGRWHGAGMSGGHTQWRDAAGTEHRAVNTYRD